MTAVRERRDRCPGVLRPWPAADGGLVRLRLVGGRTTRAQLRALLGVAATYGDGAVHLTGRANLQLRALPTVEDRLPEEVVGAIEATGLLPSRRHDLVRNVMVSPLPGGRADLRPVADRLDALVRADDRTGDLPGRFGFVLDDGRGDLLDRLLADPSDLGLVALDASCAQLRVGPAWGPVVPLDVAADHLVGLALAFLDARGAGPGAPWHVTELDRALVAPVGADPRLPAASGPPAYDERHREVPHGVLDAAYVDGLPDGGLVVTPWHGIVVP